jgi:hypothetical protein
MDELSLAKRDAVARLCQAQADGFLSIERFEERYVLIREASSSAGVEAIVADLDAEVLDEATDGQEFPALRTDPDLPAVVPPLRIPSIFGSTTRAGNWNVPGEIHLLVVMGEVNLDFRDATFTTDTVLIDVSVTMGTLKITVPSGTQVENECREILSSSKQPAPRGKHRAPPNGLLVVIRGRLLLAELVVHERASGPEPTLMERMGLVG